MMLKTLMTSAVLVMAAPALAAAVVGQPAPAFTATDTMGKTHRLSDFRGKTVVLEWHNPDCPFVKKFYGSGSMQKLQADARANGIVWLTINSGAPGKQGNMNAATTNAYMKSEGMASAAYLPDPTGVIGQAYGARTTPHMFVIDGKGTLVYAGGIDDNPSADPADIASAKNYVTAALADMKAGRAVATATSRPYGCSVKY
jgi:hypothetical protein